MKSLKCCGIPQNKRIVIVNFFAVFVIIISERCHFSIVLKGKIGLLFTLKCSGQLV